MKITLYIFLFFSFNLMSLHAMEGDMVSMGSDILKGTANVIAEKQSIAVSEIVTTRKYEEDQRIAYAISEYITEVLVKSGKFRVIEKKQIIKILNALEMAQTGLIDTGTAEVVGKLIGARYMLLGSLIKQPKSYRVSFRLVEIETALVKWAGSYDLTHDSAEYATRIYHPPSWRLHATICLNWYGFSPEGGALHSLGMSFGFRYNLFSRHWTGIQINPFFYHYGRWEDHVSSGIKTELNYYFQNAIEILPGYSYRLPVSRALAMNFGLYGGMIFYTLKESHSQIDGGVETRQEDSTSLKAPIILPQVDLSIMDNQPFSFFIRLGYFVIFRETSVSAYGFSRSDLPRGVRLEGGGSFFF